MSDRILMDKRLVVRHSLIELVEHWVIALSGLLLLVTGMFELPMANRYYITSIPGLAWSGDFIKSLYIHYAASVVFIAAAVFHLLYHGILGEGGMIPRQGDLRSSLEVIKSFFGKGEEPPFHKYLPEQRLAYAGMAFIIAMLILSGLVKTYKNIYAPDISLTWVLWATWIHNIFFVLFALAFVAHIGALVLKPNRPMIRGIFTGAVALDYARRRHPLWLKELEPVGEDAKGQEIGEETLPPDIPNAVAAKQGAGPGPPPTDVMVTDAVGQDRVDKTPPDVSPDDVDQTPEAQKTR
ncbi:MAG: cytochrome b/b6 domain-containing protein [Pseudomonadota bacterium]